MATKCANPTCPNTVPDGWEGGYCPTCCQAIEASEEEYQADRLTEERRSGSSSDAVLSDPYEEYGFDHWWETEHGG